MTKFTTTQTKKRIASAMLLSASSVLLAACNQQSQGVNSNEQAADAQASAKQHNLDIWPELDLPVKQDPKIEQKIRDMLATMTLEQKVAQMIQPEIRDISVDDMRKYGFGSYLNGGGAFPNNDKHATPADWIKLAEDMYQASIDDSEDGIAIPTMWGTDAVHGHNNVIGATLFPHNIGLGAANNPELLEEIASITATEVMVTGIDWVFAPTVAVVRDDRWGRTYEGYSEDPEIVREYSAAIVRGLQGAADKDFLGDSRVISTVKHFVGDGGTENGDDQGNNLASEQELFEIHAQGYVGGLSAGSQSVMASFNSWHGEKIHGNKYLLTDVLKNKMGFDGFVVGDWNGHGQIPGCSNDNCSQTINAGLDIFMVPTDAWKPLYENTIAQVNSGEIPMSRIDDAVSRILRVKLRAGLFDKPSPANRPVSGKLELIGASEHRAVARQAVRESLVLLKNNDQLLPLKPNQKILLAGDAADNIGKQSGGWTITWQGTGNTNADFPGGTSIYAGFEQAVTAAGGEIELAVDGAYQHKPDVAVVVFGEEPYAEGNGDLDNLEYQRGNKRDLALLKSLRAKGIPVVSVFISGRPLWVNAELNASDAFVAAWLPGSEGNGVADVLLTDAQGEIQNDFVGTLSFSWPNSATQAVVNRGDADYQPLLPYGFGLQYGDESALANDLSEETTIGSALESLNLMTLPWRQAINKQGELQFITSNTASSEFVNYRTTDRVVQEDARQIDFNGKGVGHFEINDNFPFDLRGYAEQNGAISFSYRVTDKANLSGAVYLAMRCESDCDVTFDISQWLIEAETDKWHSAKIDLACYEKKGATMDKIFAPFVLRTNGQLGITLSNIEVSLGAENSQDGQSKDHHITCE
ncbi:glycoside hydrolase family 3 N-terminal domain-containing protein [Thalassotalea litorea]|uniref:glycoside hydrolase family 3 N-terminal domain-containing protein n=1 Tax=Thalassotalea litorea TaxID=2020715 RepID=UPI003735D14F